MAQKKGIEYHVTTELTDAQVLADPRFKFPCAFSVDVSPNIVKKIQYDRNGVKSVVIFESGGSGNFIPLTGTEVGKPVTGDIELGGIDSFRKIFRGDLETYSTTISFSDDFIIRLLSQNFGESFTSIELTTTQILVRCNGNLYNTAMSIAESSINIGSNSPSFIGFEGSKDFTPNYPTDGTEDKIFPQIKYVKDNFVPKAPEDGNFYAMKDGVWIDITSKLNP